MFPVHTFWKASSIWLVWAAVYSLKNIFLYVFGSNNKSSFRLEYRYVFSSGHYCRSNISKKILDIKPSFTFDTIKS